MTARDALRGAWVPQRQRCRDETAEDAKPGPQGRVPARRGGASATHRTTAWGSIRSTVGCTCNAPSPGRRSWLWWRNWASGTRWGPVPSGKPWRREGTVREGRCRRGVGEQAGGGGGPLGSELRGPCRDQAAHPAQGHPCVPAQLRSSVWSVSLRQSRGGKAPPPPPGRLTPLHVWRPQLSELHPHLRQRPRALGTRPAVIPHRPRGALSARSLSGGTAGL